jgi:hypothetical protein
MSATALANVDKEPVSWLTSVSCLVNHTDSVLISLEAPLDETRPGCRTTGRCCRSRQLPRIEGSALCDW